MLAITNANLIMLDHMVMDAVLFVEDGKIAGYGELWKTDIPKDCEIFDAGGLYVGPGFVDIHCHASNGIRFQFDPAGSVPNTLKHGTTTLLPTLAYQYSKEVLLDGIRLVREYSKTPEGESVGGIYMEGPYLNAGFGSDKTAMSTLCWNKGVFKEDYQELIDELGDFVRVWAVAPEREGILDFVKDAKKGNPDVRFAVAHSEATPAQIEALMPYGLCIGTHHTNATGTIVKYPECRGVCVDECVNYNSGIYAELICDKVGVHVDPYMLRLIRKIKGDERIILITDASSHPGPKPPGYEGSDDLYFDMEGEIGGTKLTSDQACRNMMKHTGAGFPEAFRMASYNPATAVGFTDRGEIAVGKRADLVLIDDRVNVHGVFLGGRQVK